MLTPNNRLSTLLANKSNQPIVNTIILITKYEIYKSKWNNEKIDINYLKCISLRYMKVDLYIYRYI